MINSLLLPLTEGLPSVAARDFAFWFGRTMGCHIQALAVVDVKAFEVPVIGAPDGFMPAVVTPPLPEGRNILDELTAAAGERLDRFARECAAAGVSCATDVLTGVPWESVAREAVAHDLVVMGRTGYTASAASRQQVDPLVRQVLRGCVRPVLVAGKEFPAAGIRNLMVAYDGSAHAARALPIAALIGARPGIQCVLVNVAASQEAGAEVLEPAEAYLYHHGLSPKRQVIVAGRPSETICDQAAAQSADILVMGAYGHSPIREVLFGSTTEYVLRQCGCTVILQP